MKVCLSPAFFHTLETRVASATVMILILGLLLVEDLDLDYGTTWIWLSIALVVVATLVAAVGIGPAESRAIEAIEQNRPARALVGRIRILGMVNMGALALVLWLMIDQPA